MVNFVFLVQWESFTVKHYVPEHSFLLNTTRNWRVTTPIVANRFREMIVTMLFIRPKHLRVMVRKEMGAFITRKVCRNAKILAIKKIKEQFWEDFRVLNRYALGLKSTNLGSNVSVLSQRLR